MKVSSSKIVLLIMLILLQNICTMIIVNKEIVNNVKDTVIFKYPHVIHIIIHIIGISSVVWIIYIIKLIRIHEEDLNKLNNSTNIIQALRGQKHDFNNHLNVISGMIQMNEYKRALGYIKKVGGKTDEIFSISKIDNVEIAAILYSKCAIAESKGIEVELDINSSLNDLKIDSTELSRVLFNLIDNAIYELEKVRQGEKRLSIETKEYENKYIISICNSYPLIPKHLHDKVFERGFTTKDDDREHGYGLYIVKSIIQKNKGKITVESYEDVGTIFTVFLPKQLEHQNESISRSINV